MLTRRQILTTTAAAVPAAVIMARPVWSGSSAIYAENGVAIDGSDVVAYFAGNGPVVGDPGIALNWKGATWHFSSVENRDTFEADPSAYEPQFGGYCAWAVANGYVASTVPEAWSLHRGRLYLNYSRRIRRRWERDIEGNIALGEQNWPAVLA